METSKETDIADVRAESRQVRCRNFSDTEESPNGPAHGEGYKQGSQLVILKDRTLDAATESFGIEHISKPRNKVRISRLEKAVSSGRISW